MQKLKQDMEEIKREMQEIKEMIGTLTPPADRDMNPRLVPSLDDQVRHLKMITRGDTGLIDNNIQTVRNFMQMYKTKPIKLREILKDCSDSGQEVIVHMSSCIVDDENLNASTNPFLIPKTPLHHEFPLPHQGIYNLYHIKGNFKILCYLKPTILKGSGSAGMQNNDSNR
ncbi:hypothetical protein Ddye_005531 [Dipteronia dyeriana]|uniref:Calmodulin binding protein central domain-containing protein n=1 Tax=Dipteronia dyeriana TaxID=168575 RepID=A0AAD9XGM7_9ROSI|nr:hypothetical protein Ddye_005531 [Dipteronia dyeriana]